MRTSPKSTLLNRAVALARRREAHLIQRQQATRRCPDCGAAVTIELGVMRCTACGWRQSIHDTA